MKTNLKSYKQIRITLCGNEPCNEEYLFDLYGKYEKIENEAWQNLYSTYGLDVFGIPSNGKEDHFFEFNPDAHGVFEKLRLYETKEYTVKKRLQSIEFISIKERKDKVIDENSFTFKIINYLGKSSFGFIFDGCVYGPLRFEVVPLKIDYEDDYVQLTEDIARICSAMLLDYSSPTTLSFVHDKDTQKRTSLESFIFLRKFCSSESIDYLLQCIRSNPDRILASEEELRPFGSAPISKKFFSNPFGNSRDWIRTREGKAYPTVISHTRKYDSHDTPANRFLKFAFERFESVCDDLLSYVPNESTYRDEAMCLKQSLELALCDSIFDDVGTLEVMPVNNQVLQKREGYSQVFNAFNMMDLAQQLDWEGQDTVYEGQSRDIARLYEYWLAFKMIEITKDLGCTIDFSVEKQKDYDQMLSTEKGLLISLKEGRTSLLSMANEKLTLNLYYNRTFNRKDFDGTQYQGSYSRPFRPDYTIALFPRCYKNEEAAIEDGEVSYIHFDAKYRITDLTSLFGKEKKTDGEFEEDKALESTNTYKRGDLLKMHTYNDAIRRTIGSYVLYPGSADNSSSQFQVFDELLPGVGAFAIRPGDNERNGETILKQFLKDVIDFKAKQSSRQYRSTYFENMVLQNAGEKELFPKSDLMMVGFVRPAYLDFLKSQGIIPKSSNGLPPNNDGEFYFYYHAIKAGKVYTLHRETSQAKYLRLTKTDFYNAEIIDGNRYLELEPWVAKIISSELVSKESLQETLSNFPGKYDFSADYYYLVKAKLVEFDDYGFKVSISTDENEMISPYSPKILDLNQIGKDLLVCKDLTN